MSRTALYIADAVSGHIVELSQTRLVEMIAGYKTLKRANDELRHLTGIRRFFENREALQEFRRLVTLPSQNASRPKSREWGDFQTPSSLAMQVCHYLAETNVSPSIIVEPTFGTGNFVLAALRAFPYTELIYGVEIQEAYLWHLKIALLIKALLGEPISTEIELHQGDIFTHDFPERITRAQNILILGNPPWVTNSELGALEANNLPEKRNIRTLNGIEAVTGKSNFDIAEFILLRLLESFSQRRGTLAMLCKKSVARNIVEILPQRHFQISNIRALEINASREFGAAVEANLLVADLGAPEPTRTCQVATLGQPERFTRVFGWVRNKFVSNITDYVPNSDLDGQSTLVWRQGIKHDCSKVMELDVKENALLNGNDEIVDIEEKFTYWLLKSSDLRVFEVGRPRKKVIVTQSHPGDDTSNLKVTAPRLWKYLVKNSSYFEKRKSSIYRGKPRFSIFGIGEYSFKPYKVAISGLYKEPNFSLVLPVGNRPVMLDDTCYFLGFDTYLDALFANSLFNGPSVKRFLSSVVFLDAKRPYTKEILMRIDLARAASRLSLRTLHSLWASTGYVPREPITESDLEKYKQSFSGQSSQRERLLLEQKV